MTTEKKGKYVVYRLSDIATTVRDRIKYHENPKIRGLSKKDIRELWYEIGESVSDILEAAPTHGFNSFKLGSAGTFRLNTRIPQKIKDINTGEERMTGYVPRVYFIPSQDLRLRLRDSVNEAKSELDEE